MNKIILSILLQTYFLVLYYNFHKAHCLRTAITAPMLTCGQKVGQHFTKDTGASLVVLLYPRGRCCLLAARHAVQVTFPSWGCSIHTGVCSLYKSRAGWKIKQKYLLQTNVDPTAHVLWCLSWVTMAFFTSTFLLSTFFFLQSSKYNNINSNVRFHLLFHLHSFKSQASSREWFCELWAG